MRSSYSTCLDGLTVVALVLMAVMGVSLLSSNDPPTAEAAVPEPTALVEPPDLRRVIPPYESYVLTQGPHGQSYGHLAIDLTAGNGAAILSPIEGEVTAFFVDDLGNTTLVIENPYYQVTLLHGLYEVQVGEHVSLAQYLGRESNQGFTVDAWGNLCAGRDCGYHTHLNIFDKETGENVNPLEIMERR